jgi:hypothetical protein
MKDALFIKANNALLEGDRDEVLRCLSDVPNSPGAVWLRAHSVVSDSDRLALLNQVSISGHSIYAPLAKKILEREHHYEQELAQPPDYQFWKQPTWHAKLANLKRQKFFLAGIIFSIAMTILLVLGISIKNSSEIQTIAIQETAAVGLLNTTLTAAPMHTPTVTAIPLSRQGRIEYSAGEFWFSRYEAPTTRPVSRSGYSENEHANPAAGSTFIAVQYRFVCKQALCDYPPEAQISLRLTNGKIVSYDGYSRPYLIEFPFPPRVAQGKEVTGWLVFEVPDRASPAGLVFNTGENTGLEGEEMILELSWPNP